MKTGKRLWLVALLVFASLYAASWKFCTELQIARPMANLRYFYYGSAPDSISDWLLYCSYFPVYKMHLALQGNREIYGRVFVHWSDRRDSALK